ncbi:MAG: bifunctional (p)ppGpp synthetase/guanosine-3',5'-bis(diphosphate) 3'-pyrophosphohydrolase [Desulfitobacteriaceae bacterium]|nr:bifunctional (p)ppGpp synthetase/guanosine-3',5'-bis(diphosphate) 3'-pyrophosphohydrolase [Desulfitobacteriaceae bacterium]MDD4751837.1 bifunctional (p)ppGpp synthetase/guanosine-3',5'-bis(diphosphate) 3'-pyrophosphohydrolase [Desulfitobacteriaceae bacterium]
MDIKMLEEQIIKYNPASDVAFIQRAYDFAARAHQGQLRHSGEAYIIHPLAVAEILVMLQLDDTTLAAGLLHDVVEDTDVTIEEIAKLFSREVAVLVDGVTKLSRLEYKSKEEQQVENLRKMFLAMAKDIRVILIKLADRLHNMRTLRYHSLARQKEIAEETLEIFAPLAHRLGIFKIKWELEDLALRYLEPDKFYSLVDQIVMKRQEREQYVGEICEVLGQKLEQVGLKAEVVGRPKNLYSIYKKMVQQQKELSEIFDLVAVRVIVDNVKDCYGALGIIHTMWKPIPGRFKDYIAMPKQNMYQSIHTTVIGSKGEPFEIQIRTWDMHRTSEYGIAAHWRYKEGKSGDKDFEEKLSWLRQMLEWQQELRDAREFMESIRIDLFADSVYVFTPKGDVVELPAGSVPIDFAYRVHTQVGHWCIGAKVNGKIVPIDYKLNNGDIVEILTLKGSAPSRDWLKIVKTTQAKNRIRQWFKKEKRDENLLRGRELLEKEIKKYGHEVSYFFKPERLLDAAKRFNYQSGEDLIVAVGDGIISPIQMLTKIKEDFKKEKDASLAPPELKPWKDTGKHSKGILVRGVDNAMIRLSRCCNPLPGDPIVGYITRGRGVSIHRVDCPNVVQNHQHEKERLIEVSWDTESEGFFQVEIEAISLDRPRLAMDIMTAIADTKTTINSVHARATKNKLASVNVKIEIKSLDHLEYIMNKLRRLPDIIEVKRVTPGNM